MRHKFIPLIEKVGQVSEEYICLPLERIHDEPMLFSSDWDFARNNGGPLTNHILDCLKNIIDGHNCIIDTRSHMLMKNMYPAIPGWHCDGVPRSEKYSQPDLTKINTDIKYYTCILSTTDNVSRTEFLDEKMEINIDDENVWSSLDRDLTYRLVYKSYELVEGDIVLFDQNTPHRASPCINPGWRFFFRLGLLSKEPQNKIRKQVQVYTIQGIGW